VTEPQPEKQADWKPDQITEPPNSTVDDWMGQRVERDEERAEEALEAADGDEREAERRFEETTERRPDEPVSDG
jgi:hypothetical protein